MRVVVNGAPRDLPDGTNVGDVVRSERGTAAGPGVAAARNDEVVPRGAWDVTVLDDGDRVEVLVATQGG